jgi:hemerythrin-like domain-containing protein
MTTTDLPTTRPTDCEIPDLLGYRLVHRALRWGVDLLAHRAPTVDPIDRRTAAAFVAWTRGYLGELHAHHTIEDHTVFPALVERVPITASMIERTTVDHETMDLIVERIEAGLALLGSGVRADDLAPALAELAELMTAHLDFEDAEVLPVIERHFSAAEWQLLDEQAKKSLKVGKQALFTVPFVVAMATGDEVDGIWDSAPSALKVIYRLTRRGFARRTGALFGGGS